MISPSTEAAAIFTRSIPHTVDAITTTITYPTGIARFAGHRKPTNNTPIESNGNSASRLSTAKFSTPPPSLSGYLSEQGYGGSGGLSPRSGFGTAGA